MSQNLRKTLSPPPNFFGMVRLWFYEFELDLRGCRSGCNIKGGRKGIKPQLLAFDIAKSKRLVIQTDLRATCLSPLV